MEESKVKLKSDFLFSKSTFWDGIASVLNLPGNYYEFNTSKSPEEADKKALISDWENVGEDIRQARKRFEKDNEEGIKLTCKKLCLNK